MKNSATVLVVDDDRVTRSVVREALIELGCTEVLEAGDGIEAQEILRVRPEIDLVIVDIIMPRLDGLGLVAWAREHCPGPVYVILSALDRFDQAVNAIRLGAFDFLAKPIRNEELEVSVRNALEHRALLLERARLQADLLKKVDELEHKSRLMQRDLQRAEIIQRALLPQAPPPLEQHSVRAVYRPGRYVGGDLYDVTRIGDDLAFYVADATGHGVTAAMLSVLFKERLRPVDESGRARSPAAVLTDANLALADAVNAPGLFLTAAYGVLNLITGELTVASAGHPPVLHQQGRGRPRLIRRTGPALGLSAEARFQEERCQLGSGDRLLLYTDGLVGSDDTAAAKRLCDVLESGPEGPLELMTQLQADPSSSNANSDEIDDVTVLLLDAQSGASWCDNGAAPTRSSLERRIDSRQPVVFHGESDEAWFLTLRGRATWLHSDAFYEAGCSMLEEHHTLVIDLEECDYLDSTALGTVHELVGHGQVRVQGVQPAVRALFEELSMRNVLDQVTEPVPRPDLYPLTTASIASAGQLRILRAHEALAALDSSNRDRFQSVLEAMRSRTR
ncbi:MAG: SpoIIE family protein phosphatase [Gemmatimonadota bacterium]